MLSIDKSLMMLADGNVSTTSQNVDLIHVSLPSLFISVTPLFGLAVLSWHMGLELESPLIVGTFRTFIQLSILGAILHPIFESGRWWIVILYVLFMLGLASIEATARTKYVFEGMQRAVLISFVVNVGLVSIFAFGGILRPTPVWNPQYVIPIIGMLLGNCINGVALALNAFLCSLVEQSNEIEVYLAFGASIPEAAARLMRDAIRVGAMPMLNSMAVIGLISIPGMMTGQILGGSSVVDAARYQMLIIYLITICAFGTILMEIWLAMYVGFDPKTQMLRLDRLIVNRTSSRTIFRSIKNRIFRRSGSIPADDDSAEAEPICSKSSEHSYYNTMKPPQPLQISLIRAGARQSTAVHPSPTSLTVSLLSKTVRAKECYRNLFENVSFTVHEGDIFSVRGPSGTGKTQLFRVLAGLSPADAPGRISFLGTSPESTDYSYWRRRIRYVTQTKIDIPGTPRQFITRVSSFQSWRQPLAHDMVQSTIKYLESWGLDAAILDQEWKALSGGEAQRVYLAIAIASGPTVLLLDESTSALDMASKTRVEETVVKVVQEQGISVLWISHDTDQVQRISLV